MEHLRDEVQVAD